MDLWQRMEGNRRGLRNEQEDEYELGNSLDNKFIT
jgi:hypothetical protein